MIRALALALLLSTPAVAQTVNDTESATPYAQVRGWSVDTMGDGRGVFACRATRGRGYERQIMLTYDGFLEAWLLHVRASRPEGGGFGIKGAAVTIDGRMQDRQMGFGRPAADGASDSHARLRLSGRDLRQLMAGRTLEIEIAGERPRRWSLAGSTAATLKVVECARRWGFGPPGF
jgi:hypothetical protein